MKKLRYVLPALLLGVGAVLAQAPSMQYSSPTPPPPEVLERLNLQPAWRVRVPMDGRKDGFQSIQVLEKEVFAQTRSGLVTAIDLGSGQVRWSTRVGKPYMPQYELGFNDLAVFVTNGNEMFALDRRTGEQLGKIRLAGSPLCGPLADDNQLYISYFDNVNLFVFPRRIGKVPDKGGLVDREFPMAIRGAGEAKPIAQPGEPVFQYEWRIFERNDLKPVLTNSVLFLLETNGDAAALSTRADRKEVYRGYLGMPTTTRMGHHEDMVYVPTADFNVHAVDTINARRLWRFAGGSFTQQMPVSNDKDVYVVLAGSGLHRLDRDTGFDQWARSVTAAGRVLAANPKFVYAVDRSNRLMVIDRKLGTVLSGYNTRDYTVPVLNEYTDRIMLAANDGQILCLHDRDYPRPLVMKYAPMPKPMAEEGAKPGMMEEGAKPGENP